MPIEGTINSLYLDYEQTKPLFPRTKTKAISDDNGTGLNVLLDNIHKEIDGLTYSDVGAAPAGYGLGDTYGILLDSSHNLDNITKSGWYWWYDTRPSGATYNYCHMRVDTGDSRVNYSVTQTIIRDSMYEVIVRHNDGTKWITEWVNPPMVAGVEYRTTERWNGNPIYTMLISYGKGPASGAANLYLKFPQNAVFTELHCKGVQDDGWGYMQDEYLSFGENGTAEAASIVSISGAGDLSAQNLYLTAKYYKA